MERQRFVSRPTLVRIIVLVGWAVFLISLLVSGQYRNYLHPDLAWLLVGAVILLAAMAAALGAALRIDHVPTPECENGQVPCGYRHRLRPRDIKPLIVFAIPILIVVLMPLSQGLSASMVGGIYTDDLDRQLTGELLSQGKRETVDGLPVYFIPEVQGAPDQIPEKAAVIGMVYKTRKVKAPRFYLVRFSLSCCAADARPIMLEIDPSEDTRLDYSRLPNNVWIAAKGRAIIEEGRSVFKAFEIKLIEKPEDEYVY